MSNKIIKKTSGSVLTDGGLPIRYDLYYPHPAPEILKPVLFVHGFKGFKDWGPFPDACAEIASENLAVIAFNHSLNGVGENSCDFDRLDLFERQTLSQDQEDIAVLLQAITDQTISVNGIRFNHGSVGIIGHSRGGHTAVTAAAEQDVIDRLVTWSAVSDYRKFWSEDMISDWKSKGYTEIRNARTGQMMRIDKVVYEDLMANASRLLAAERVKSLYIPCCFIHARDDESVPVRSVNELFANCPSMEKKKVIIEKTGHTYGASHPFDSEDFPAKFQELLDHTKSWLTE